MAEQIDFSTLDDAALATFDVSKHVTDEVDVAMMKKALRAELKRRNAAKDAESYKEQRIQAELAVRTRINGLPPMPQPKIDAKGEVN